MKFFRAVNTRIKENAIMIVTTKDNQELYIQNENELINGLCTVTDDNVSIIDGYEINRNNISKISFTEKFNLDHIPDNFCDSIMNQFTMENFPINIKSIGENFLANSYYNTPFAIPDTVTSIGNGFFYNKKYNSPNTITVSSNFINAIDPNNCDKIFGSDDISNGIFVSGVNIEGLAEEEYIQLENILYNNAKVPYRNIIYPNRVLYATLTVSGSSIYVYGEKLFKQICCSDDANDATFGLQGKAFTKANITAIVIGAGYELDYIPDSFLKNFTALTSNVTFNNTIKPNIISIGNDFLYNCSRLNADLHVNLFQGLTSCKSIGNNFMVGVNKYSQAIELPDSVEIIGDNFFKDRTNYTYGVHIPYNIKNIGNDFLSGCTGYQYCIVVPEGIQHIGTGFMHNCNNFPQSTTITLDVYDSFVDAIQSDDDTLSTDTETANIYTTGVQISGISEEKFNELLAKLPNRDSAPFRKLTYFSYIMRVNLGISNNFFPYYIQDQSLIGNLATTGAATTTVRVGTSNVTKNTIYDVKFGPSCTIEAIPDNFCRNFSTMKHLNKLPSTVKTIGTYFLYSCNQFNAPVDLTGITSIGTYFLSSCSSFNHEITIPETLTTIDVGFMTGCYKFNSKINFHSGIISIGTNFMQSCSGYNQPIDLTILENCTSIGDYFMYATYDFTGPLTLDEHIVDLLPSSTSVFSSSSSANSYKFGVDIAGLDVEQSRTLLTKLPNRRYRRFNTVIPAVCKVTHTDGTIAKLIDDADISKMCTSASTSSQTGWTFELDGVLFNKTSVQKIEFTNECKITTLPNYFAFYMSNLEEVIGLPQTLTSIQSSCFSNCDKLNCDLVLPNSITTIGVQSIYNLKAFNSDIVLPSNLESVGNYVITSLTSFDKPLTIPASLKTVGNYFIYGNTILNSPITLRGTIETTGTYFMANNSKFNLNLNDVLTHLQTIGNFTFSGLYEFNQPLTIPENIVKINHGFFSNCRNFIGPLTLTSTFADRLDTKVTSIFTSGSSYESYKHGIDIDGLSIEESKILMEKLPNINNFRKLNTIIPPLIKIKMKDDTYNNIILESDITNLCYISNNTTVVTINGLSVTKNNILEIEFMNDYRPTSIPNGFCQYFNGLTTINSLPDSVTTIGDNFLYSCAELNCPITIPNSVTSVGSYFLSYNKKFNSKIILSENLESVGNNSIASNDIFNQPITFPESLTTIGTYFFSNNLAFNHPLSVPPSLTSIPNGFFSVLQSFNSELTIPDTVTSIGSYFLTNAYSFNRPLDLTNLTNLTSIGTQFMNGIREFVGPLKLNQTIINAFTASDTYTLSTASSYNSYKQGIEIDGLTIDESKSLLTKLPNIASGSKCRKLNTIIPVLVKVTDTSNSVVNGISDTDINVLCNSATSTTTNITINGIGIQKRYIKKIEFTENATLTKIPDYFGYYFTGLEEVINIPETVTEIGNYFLNNCSGFNNELILPDSVTTIGTYFMRNLNTFNSNLYLGNGLKTIGAYFFNNNNAFDKTMKIPESVTRINDYFMNTCNNFKMLELSQNIIDSGYIYASDYSLSTTSSTAASYTGGINISGLTTAGFEKLIAKWPNRTTSPYRKLKQFVPENILIILLDNGSEIYCQSSEIPLLCTTGASTSTITLENGSFTKSQVTSVSFSSNWSLTSLPENFLCEFDHLTSLNTVPATITDIGTGFLKNCDAFEGPLSYNDNFPTAIKQDGSSLSTDDNTSLMYTNGVEFRHETDTGWDTIISKWPNSDTNPYRKIRLQLPIFRITLVDTRTLYGYNENDVNTFSESDVSNQKVIDNVKFIPKTQVKTFEFLPNWTLTNIPAYFCHYLDELTTINEMPQSITTLGGESTNHQKYIFERCPKLNCPITFSDNIEEIGYNVMTDLAIFNSTVHLPNKLKKIKGYCLYKMPKFNTALTLPDSIEYIGGLLQQCTSFNQPLTIPKTSHRIELIMELLEGSTAFNKPITIPSNVDEVSYFLSGCTAFNSAITIESGVKSVGHNFLYNCNIFNQQITLPSTITKIGRSFMNGCYAYNKSMNIPSSIITINSSFMANCRQFSGPLNVENSAAFRDMVLNENDNDGPFTNFLLTIEVDKSSTAYRNWASLKNGVSITGMNGKDWHAIISHFRPSTDIGSESTPEFRILYPSDLTPYVTFTHNYFEIPGITNYLSPNYFKMSCYDIDVANFVLAQDDSYGKNFAIKWPIDESIGLEEGKDGSMIYSNVDYDNIKKIEIHDDMKSHVEKISQYAYDPMVLEYFTPIDELTNLKIIGDSCFTIAYHYNQSDRMNQIPSILSQTITIPASVTSIGDNFMCNNEEGSTTENYFDTSTESKYTTVCNKFSRGEIVFASNSKLTSIGTNFLSGYQTYNHSLTLPSSLRSIGNSFMEYCNISTGTITLNQGLQTIGKFFLNHIFRYSQPITLPSSLTSIGAYLFSGMENFVGPVTVNCPFSSFDNSGDGQYMNSSSGCNFGCYNNWLRTTCPSITTGITIKGLSGTNLTQFKEYFSNFDNTRSGNSNVHYGRKLIYG